MLGGRCALSGCALSGCAFGLLLLFGGPLDLSKHQLIRDGSMARRGAAWHRQEKSAMAPYVACNVRCRARANRLEQKDLPGSVCRSACLPRANAYREGHCAAKPHLTCLLVARHVICTNAPPPIHK